MAAIKTLEKSADKWQRRASAASQDYLAGVENPRRPWADAALKAEGNYKAGVTAAANAGRYAAGVKRAGNEKWAEKARLKGPGHFAEGVQIAVAEWQRGFAPFHQAFQALSLPERGPRRSEQNFNRVRIVGQTFGAVKDKIMSQTR